MMLAMGFTGKEAAEWKERFIAAFNFMGRKLWHMEAREVALLSERREAIAADVLLRDTVKESFIPLVADQGSKNAKHYWAAFARLLDRCAGIGTGQRQVSPAEVQSKLMMVANVLIYIVKTEVTMPGKYHEIYRRIATKAETFFGVPPVKHRPHKSKPVESEA